MIIPGAIPFKLPSHVAENQLVSLKWQTIILVLPSSQLLAPDISYTLEVYNESD